MKKENEGGPAFPYREAERYNPKNRETHLIEGDPGMSLRDYFAAHATAALIANPSAFKLLCQQSLDPQYPVADAAYGVADAMLAERQK